MEAAWWRPRRLRHRGRRRRSNWLRCFRTMASVMWRSLWARPMTLGATMTMRATGSRRRCRLAHPPACHRSRHRHEAVLGRQGVGGVLQGYGQSWRPPTSRPALRPAPRARQRHVLRHHTHRGGWSGRPRQRATCTVNRLAMLCEAAAARSHHHTPCHDRSPEAVGATRLAPPLAAPVVVAVATWPGRHRLARCGRSMPGQQRPWQRRKHAHASSRRSRRR